ncbi:MAG: biopolymer transporter ExbD [Planctomycetaceae bacterium]|nr:biopolymer transporter ExbD [Planctomycetaceae bacterium]
MRIPSQYLHGDRDRDYGVMTPMIDVVFQLLIFFVIASTGHVAESLLPTQLPASGAIASPVPRTERESWADEVFVKLSRNADGRTVADLNGTAYDDLHRLNGVLRALAEVSRDNPIVLDIEDTVPLGEAIRVYDACRSAGFESINFAADPEDVQ